MKTIPRRMYILRIDFIQKGDGFQFSLLKGSNFAMILDDAQNANDRLLLFLVVSNLRYKLLNNLNNITENILYHKTKNDILGKCF